MNGLAAADQVRARVLVVEDDAAVARLLGRYLEGEGYRVSHAATAGQMRSAVEAEAIDFVLLDIGLPDEDGWSALRWLRARSAVPVIVLTGSGETIDRVLGFEMGADGYLPKPFERRELLARMRSIQRRLRASTQRTQSQCGDVIEFAGWVLDPSSETLKSERGEPVSLTQAEYRMLLVLARSPNCAVTRDQLSNAVAGRGWSPLDRSIDVHVSNLRRKLDRSADAPSLIRTVRGSGYMLVPGRRSPESSTTRPRSGAADLGGPSILSV